MNLLFAQFTDVFFIEFWVLFVMEVGLPIQSNFSVRLGNRVEGLSCARALTTFMRMCAWWYATIVM